MKIENVSVLDIEKHIYKTLAPDFYRGEDIVHAVVKTIDKHEQGTASGSWSWNNSI